MIGHRLFLMVVLIVFCALGCAHSHSSKVPRSPQPAEDLLTDRTSYELGREIIADPNLAEPSGFITLRQALAYVLVYNPELSVFAWEVRVSEAHELQARVLPNPIIQFEMENVGGAGTRSSFDAAETTLQLSQLVELGDKRAKRARVASLETQLATWDYEVKRLEIFKRVSLAFMEVLAAQEKLQLMEEELRLSEEVLEMVSTRVKAGKDSPVEEMKAQVAWSSVRIEWKQARQHFDSSRKRLASTWGSSSAKFEKVTGQFDAVVPIPPEHNLVGLLGRTPRMARWATEIEHRNASLKLQESKIMSDPVVAGGMRRFSVTDDNAFVFGVSVPLPLFDRNQGMVLAAKHDIAKAHDERRVTEAAVYADFATTYESLSNAYTAVRDLNSEVLTGAQNALAAAQEGYRQGKLDYLDVLDAQRTLFAVRQGYIDSLAGYHNARTSIECLIGQKLAAVVDTAENDN